MFAPAHGPGSNHAGPRSALFLGALLLPVFGCNSSPPPLVLDVRVVTPAGLNPVSGGGFDTATIRVREGGGDARELTAPIVGGTFDFAVSFTDLDPKLQLGLRLDGPGQHLIGAPPPFRPALSGSALVIPVGVPGTCEAVAGVSLDVERADLGLARVGTFALAIGGRTAAAPEANGRYLDLLLLDVRRPLALGPALGRTRARALSESALLVLGEDRALLLDDGVVPVSLHPGAGPDSGVAARPGGGLTVMGGGSESSPSSGVSQLDATGSVERLGTLLTPRFRPAAAKVGDDVWVAGGTAIGDLVESVAPGRAATTLVADVSDGLRLGAALFVDPAASRALLLGGVAADGTPRRDTWLIVCDPGCTASAGPDWDSARAGASFVPETNSIVGGDGPSDFVERVTFDAEGAHIGSVARLVHARAAAASIALESGLLWVVGGEDDVGLRRDTELCFPIELAAP